MQKSEGPPRIFAQGFYTGICFVIVNSLYLGIIRKKVMKHATAEFIVYYIFIPLNVISYILRDRKPFNIIWRVLLCFWIALGLAVVIQNIQDKFKDSK